MLVIFDCDGVLVDSEMIASQVLADAISAVGYPLTGAQCRARFTGKSLASVFEELSADVTLPEDFFDSLRARDIAAFEQNLKAIPHINAALDAIDATVCVASSGRMEKIRHSLTLTGLLDRFEPNLFSAEQVANGKPAPDLFLYTAFRMKAEPTACIVIEDSVAGIEAARAAGMWAFGFSGGSHCDADHGEALRDAGADVVFSDMRELAGMLPEQ